MATMCIYIERDNALVCVPTNHSGQLIRQAPTAIADFNKRCQKCVANEACDALDKLQAFAAGEAASNGQSSGAGFVAGVASSSAGPANLAGGSSGMDIPDPSRRRASRRIFALRVQLELRFLLC